ncbi:AAA family ATPase [Lysinibacillus sp. SGAir0095]|uniref:AAA family ATPase n=1 Tax=Lysinibacillus sp. SGAir0095 TaxID=2070463 RepID=UPI00143DA0BD|nr:AAA family ATPase [Lysinibacillus sp. SGAir0095]
MFTFKVDYYSQKNYRKYIESRREEDIEILTVPLLELNQGGIDDFLSETEVDIDLTSAIKISKINDSINYVLEKIIYLLINHNVNFLIEETYLDELLNSFPYFVEGEKVDLDISEEVVTGNEVLKVGKNLIVNDERSFDELIYYLNQHLIGHEAFKKRFIEEVKVYKYFNKVIRDQPILSIFLLGPSGTGKTEIGRTLHKYLDETNSVAKINLANYKSESSLSSLIGSPPGYIGSKEESDLVRKINNSNAGLLIIDEFEKADGAIHNFFLQLLEEGKFDDALGNIRNLNGYVVIFTSNFKRNEFLEKVPSELRSRFNLIIECSYLNFEQRIEYLEKIFEEYCIQAGIPLNKQELNGLISMIEFKEEYNLRKLKQMTRQAFFDTYKDRLK